MYVEVVEQVRSRKGTLIPLKHSLNDENEIKIEIVDMISRGEIRFEGQVIEVVTSTSPGGSGRQSGETGESTRSDDHPRPRKRVKLDHLSKEQRAQRRKMMNRISAQSARDRQRNLMIQHEGTIKNLTHTNDVLQNENKKLKAENEKLTEENAVIAAKSLAETQRLEKLVKDLEKQLKESDQARKQSELENDVKVLFRCPSTSEPAELEKYPLLKGPPDLQQTLTFILLMWTLSSWTWTRQRSLRLLNTFPKRSCVRTPILLHLNRLLREEERKSLVNNPQQKHSGTFGPMSGVVGPIKIEDTE